MRDDGSRDGRGEHLQSVKLELFEFCDEVWDVHRLALIEFSQTRLELRSTLVNSSRGMKGDAREGVHDDG